MQNLGENNKTSAARPYWLLLALVLFFAGQIATASHWHDELNTPDADCTLCVLSSATGAALTSAPLIVASITLCTFILVETSRTFIARRVHAYDSRAPPHYS